MSQVLLVDDHVNVRRSMALLLEQDDHQVIEADSTGEALRLAASHPIDVVVTDMRMGTETDGVTLLRELRASNRDVQVVLITAFGTIDGAVEAIKSGAYDYLTKPANPERLLLTVRRAAERCALAREVRQLRAQVGEEDQIVAVSPQMQQVLATVEQFASSDCTVLITGESGTGKELVARALYTQSARRSHRFVPINCGAIPENLLESELFGHRKGAFTGAVVDKRGLLEEADRGVLFLDELGEMPLPMQVRLLRFLQSGEVRRVGDTATRRVDVRIIAATHRALEDEIAQGRFRQDFYYRINVVTIAIPPLRERPEDIPAMAEFFLRRKAARLRKPVVGFSPEALSLLQSYHWPGNARELENAIERAANLASGPLLTEADLPASITLRTPAADAALTGPDERSRIVSALKTARYNQSRAAVILGINRTTLWRKMRELQIEA
ncbi:MAG: sigma-54-dependent Fis family transcriptional regulator [Acidobacteria bacterium]|nr:sigma-54-dependent Fis family transcriptional regulator [Acidobacteriota bacterium]